MKSVEVKICGLTNLTDALTASENGADYLGFVLYPGSPRHIAPAALERLVGKLPPKCRTVGVFVNEQPGRVVDIARSCGLHAVQIHGDEAAQEFAGLPWTLWRAVRLAGGAWLPDPGQWPAARVVVDAAAPGYGGSGETADWDRAAELARQRPVLLAGGLTPDNVAEAVRRVQPVGVDVASGVEARPGVKDPSLVKAFIRNAKQAVEQERRET